MQVQNKDSVIEYLILQSNKCQGYGYKIYNFQKIDIDQLIY